MSNAVPQAATPPAADDPIIWRPDLTKAYKVCGETVRLWMKSGKLPQPDERMSAKTMGWRRSTLRAHGITLF